MMLPGGARPAEMHRRSRSRRRRHVLLLLLLLLSAASDRPRGPPAVGAGDTTERVDGGVPDVAQAEKRARARASPPSSSAAAAAYLAAGGHFAPRTSVRVVRRREVRGRRGSYGAPCSSSSSAAGTPRGPRPALAALPVLAGDGGGARDQDESGGVLGYSEEAVAASEAGLEQHRNAQVGGGGNAAAAAAAACYSGQRLLLLTTLITGIDRTRLPRRLVAITATTGRTIGWEFLRQHTRAQGGGLNPATNTSISSREYKSCRVSCIARSKTPRQRQRLPDNHSSAASSQPGSR